MMLQAIGGPITSLLISTWYGTSIGTVLLVHLDLNASFYGHVVVLTLINSGVHSRKKK